MGVGVRVGLTVAVEVGRGVAVSVGVGVAAGTDRQAERRLEKRIASRGIIFRGGWIIRTRKPELFLRIWSFSPGAVEKMITRSSANPITELPPISVS